MEVHSENGDITSSTSRSSLVEIAESRSAKRKICDKESSRPTKICRPLNCQNESVSSFISGAMRLEHDLKIENLRLEIDCAHQLNALFRRHNAAVEKQHTLAENQCALTRIKLQQKCLEPQDILVGIECITEEPVLSN